MDCHPDCLKVCSVLLSRICGYLLNDRPVSHMMLIFRVFLQCGVCAKALGDLLTPMFLCNQVIQCDGCFAIALKT